MSLHVFGPVGVSPFRKQHQLLLQLRRLAMLLRLTNLADVQAERASKNTLLLFESSVVCFGLKQADPAESAAAAAYLVDPLKSLSFRRDLPQQIRARTIRTSSRD